MRITYHKDVDLLEIEFSASPREETRDISPYAWAEFHKDERLVAITIQQASEHTDLKRLPKVVNPNDAIQRLCVTEHGALLWRGSSPYSVPGQPQPFLFC